MKGNSMYKGQKLQACSLETIAADQKDGLTRWPKGVMPRVLQAKGVRVYFHINNICILMYLECV
jgi:hypothetical protein